MADNVKRSIYRVKYRVWKNGEYWQEAENSLVVLANTPKEAFDAVVKRHTGQACIVSCCDVAFEFDVDIVTT